MIRHLMAVVAIVLGFENPAAHAAELTVQITDLESSEGQLIVAIHNRESSFPDRWDEALQVISIPAARAPRSVVFSDLQHGNYAVIAVHDADSNGEMTKNFFGWPLEGFGASNNPTFFGPPRYRSAEV